MGGFPPPKKKIKMPEMNTVRGHLSYIRKEQSHRRREVPSADKWTGTC